MRGMTALVWLGSAVDPDEVNIQWLGLCLVYLWKSNISELWHANDYWLVDRISDVGFVCYCSLIGSEVSMFCFSGNSL